MKKQIIFAMLVGVVLGALVLFGRFSAAPEELGVSSLSWIDPTGTSKKAAIQNYRLHQSKRARATLATYPRVSVASSLLKQWDCAPMVFDVGFSPDGASLAVAGDGGNSWGAVDVRSTQDWTSRANMTGRTRFAWSPDSRLLAVENRGVDVWDVRAKTLLHTLTDGTGIGSAGKNGSPGVYGPLLFSADSSKLATLGEDPASTWKLDDGPNTEAAYARTIAIKIWDVSNGKRLLVQPGPWSMSSNFLVRLTDNPAVVGFAHVAGTSSRYTVSATAPKVYVFSTHTSQRQLFGLAVHPDQPYVTIALPQPLGGAAIAGNAWIYGGIDFNANAVEIFRTADQKRLLRLTFRGQISRVTSLAISPDATTLAVAGDIPYSLHPTNQSRVLIYRLTFKK